MDSRAKKGAREKVQASRPTSIIRTACQTLMSASQKASKDVTEFVRACRSSRGDLAPVTRELSELLLVLQLLDDYDLQRADQRGPVIPDEVQTHLRPIMANCTAVVQRLDAVLRRHAEAEAESPQRWTAEGRAEVRELAGSLGAHRELLGLASDLVAVLASRGGGGGGEGARRRQVSEKLEELRGLGSSVALSYSNAALAREHFALQVHLGQIVAYAEALAGTEAWEVAVRTLDEVVAPGSGLGHKDMRSSTTPTPPRVDIPGPGEMRNPRLPHTGPKRVLPTPSQDAQRAESVTPNAPSGTTNTSAEGVATPVTGFVVMDGLLNSGHGNLADDTPRQPTISEHSGKKGGLLAALSRSRSSSRRTSSSRYSQDAPERSPGGLATKLKPRPSLNTRSSSRASAAGLELVVPNNEEEVKVKASEPEPEQISAEALAFAQVPVHVLGRSSVNSVGQLYAGTAPRGEEADRYSHDRTLSTIKTAGVEAEDDHDGDDDDDDETGSDGTDDTGSLQYGNLQFSQIDLSKLPSSSSQPASATHAASPATSDTHSLFRSPSLPASHQMSGSSLTSSTQESPRSPSNPRFLHAAQQPPVQRGLRGMQSTSTMSTQRSAVHKPLPRPPIVHIPRFPGPFIKKKAVVVGNFSCGKTCLISRIAKGHYPRDKSDKCSIVETVRVAVDEEPMELCLWDIRGVDYDPTWLKDAHVALVCFSVNIGSTDSKGKHLGRWVAEVNRNCPGAAILLVGLKSDIRTHARSVEKLRRSGKSLVTPDQGERFRDDIGASRYLECSARTGDGVLEVLGETARVAMQVANSKKTKTAAAPPWKGHQARPLSRIGKLFGVGGGREGG